LHTAFNQNTQFYHLNIFTMKALKTVGIILAALIGLVLLLGLIAPKNFDLERSVVIEAPPEQVFPHIRYFAKQDAWYPWKKYDPNMVTTVEGTDGEIGAVYTWSGNEDVGKGQQTITALEENKRMETDLQFIEPFESSADAYFHLDEVPAGTEVRWGFKSEMPFPFNIMGLFVNMEKSVGKDYESGLTALKEIVENEAPISSTFRGYEVQTTTLPATKYAIVRATLRFHNMQEFLDRETHELAEAIKARGDIVGPMTCMYYMWDEANETTDMALAMPVAENLDMEEPYSMLQFPTTQALLVDYYGDYDNLGEAHYAMDDYVKTHGIQLAELPVLEVYVTDPMEETDSSKWLTKIYYPIQS